MKNLHTLVFLLLTSTCTSIYATDSNSSYTSLFQYQPNEFELLHSDSFNESSSTNLNYNYSNDQFTLGNENDDWIKTQINNQNIAYSVSTNKNITFGNEVSFAWNFTKFLKINLNVFENKLQKNNFDSLEGINKVYNNSYNKSASQDFSDEVNKSISGYKFGISSELGFGNNYKLDLNFDYGQLDGADLIGFNNNEISTTSFALGIRKSKFGASVNTDIFLEENIDLIDSSRLGFEIDWYFSDETKISLGSKQRINDTLTDTNNSLDSLTGNVQYIKFQHNL